MITLRNYSFRNFIKEKSCQVHDLVEYAYGHPYSELKRQTLLDTVEFIKANCPRALGLRSPRQVLNYALSRLKEKNIMALEFGVFAGHSINFIAKKLPHSTIHGFDSFEGLHEDWVNNPRGTFNQQGQLPKVSENVTLYKGYFEDTLPKWSNEHDGPIGFLHVDCDLGSSTQTIFNLLEKRLVPGVIIVFDDYFNFASWREDGHKVFMDFLDRTHLSAKYLAYAFKELAVEITE